MISIVEILKENGKIKVKSAYNADFIRRAKEINGKWDAPYWVFPDDNELLVRDLCFMVYGEDGRPHETVTLEVNLDECSLEENSGNIKLKGIVLCSRHWRDSPVKVTENVAVIKGEFKSSGGSAKYPCVTWEEGTILKVKNIPVEIYKQLENTNGIKIIDNKNDKKRTLLNEREKILYRLTEIDNEIKKLN